MKTPFTQGPWQFIQQIYPRPAYYLVYDNCLENELDLNDEANRNLIEAAPEMYKALQTIITYAEAHGGIAPILDTAIIAVLHANGTIKAA